MQVHFLNPCRNGEASLKPLLCWPECLDLKTRIHLKKFNFIVNGEHLLMACENLS